MATVERRYDKEESARRGDAIYHGEIRPLLNKTDDGMFLAIDIETGEYAIDADELKAGRNRSIGRPHAGRRAANRSRIELRSRC